MKSKAKSAKKARTRKKLRADYYDYSLVAVIILLTCFGLIMLYSTSSYMAEVKYGNDMFYFKKQAAISVACIVMALIISRIDYHILYYFTTTTTTIYIFFDFGFKPNRFEKNPFGMINFPIVNLDKI